MKCEGSQGKVDTQQVAREGEKEPDFQRGFWGEVLYILEETPILHLPMKHLVK